MRIIYVHHGHREKNTPPTQEDDLTAFGYKDCELIAQIFQQEKMIKERVKAIYTSPFFRCKKTAEIINKHLNVPIYYDDRLNEFGSVKEDWVQLQERVMKCIDNILEIYTEDDIVICVTSGVNLVGFMNYAYHLSPDKDAPFAGVISCSPIIFNIKEKRGIHEIRRI